MRIVNNLYGQKSGGGLPNLTNVTFASDRGYWSLPLVFSFLLKAGADILGTVKRCSWFPFTYETSIQDGDARTSLSLRGMKNAFHKTLKWTDSAIEAIAYRSGTGTSMSLAMSSEHRTRHWDLCFKHPKSSVWYFDDKLSETERKMKCFHIYREVDIDCKSLILSKPIVPRTVEQGSAEWFLDRGFSATSHTTDKLIRAAAPTINHVHPKRRSYEIVLKYAGLSQLLPEETDNAIVEQEDQEDVSITATESQIWIDCVCRNAEGRDEFLEVLPTLDHRMLLSMAASLKSGIKSTCSTESLKRKLKDWANCDATKRPYYFMKVSELRQECRKLGIDGIHGKKREDLIICLVEKQQQQPLDGLDSNIHHQQQDLEHGADCNPILCSFLQATFLKPLGKSSKKYAKIGSDLEKPFLQSVLEHSGAGLTGTIRFETLFDCGLVSSSSRPYLKTSADAIGIYYDWNKSPQVMPIEVKARVTPRTFWNERDTLRQNLGPEASLACGKATYKHL